MAFDTIIVPNAWASSVRHSCSQCFGCPADRHQATPGRSANVQADAAREHEGGIWNWLFGKQVPLTETKAFEEAVDSGGIIVSVSVMEDEADTVMRTLRSFFPLVIGKT